MEFSALVGSFQRPVILLEGTRRLPPDISPSLVRLAEKLTRDFPQAVFRSGNAEGADSAFAEGVLCVDARRLEVVLPYTGHRRKHVPAEAQTFALSDLPHLAEKTAEYTTKQASPDYGDLLDKRARVPALKMKSNYLLRDTLKVAGAAELNLAPASLGIFYVNPDNPDKGGTAHTIRVCQHLGVPIVDQFVWMNWIKEGD